MDGMPVTHPASGTPAHSDHVTAQDEVVQICRDLIRIDTTNYGDGSGPGERAAAEHVMGLLTEVGLDPELFESTPGRASVVVRLEGRGPDPSGARAARAPRRRARATPPTGRSTRSPARSATGCSGAAAPST